MSCFDALLGGLPMSTAALLLVLFSSSVELIGAKSVQPVNATIATPASATRRINSAGARLPSEAVLCMCRSTINGILPGQVKTHRDNRADKARPA